MKVPHLVPLKIMEVANGNVLHGLKHTEDSFLGFGELYFSRIRYDTIKGWKRHKRCTLNLIVVEGCVSFFVCPNSHLDQPQRDSILTFKLGPGCNHQRLVVPPNYWMAFKGNLEGANIIASVIDELHDPAESDTTEIELSDKSVFEKVIKL